MSLRWRIFLAVVAPAVSTLALFSTLVWVEVRAERLADLDASLQARAAALTRSVEHDGVWEIDAIPESVTEGLTGYRVAAGDGAILVDAGRLSGRVWTGELDVETEGAPRRVVVAVAADDGPVLAEIRALVGRLALAGAGLAAIAATVGALLARQIVASADFRRLQGAWERQAAFTADASHELRTPLATVRAQAEVALRRERTAAEYRAALAAIEEAAARIQDLLEGLLVLARVDEPAPSALVDAAAVVRAAVAERSEGGASIRVAAPAEAWVAGDERLMRILVDNLLSNALRHTVAGEVRVTLQAERSAWRLTVADTGEGIAPEHVGRVFERFYRVDPARTRTAGGAGLGLSIVRAIAERHGGAVDLASAVGAGTTVTVHLPRGVSGGPPRTG